MLGASRGRTWGLIGAGAALLLGGLTSAQSGEPVLTSDGNRFPIQPYKRNFVLPFTYDDEAPSTRKAEELKYSLSFKMNLIEAPGWDLYVGYSQKSFWQVYDEQDSRPFRETNYNPEFFLDFGKSMPSPQWGLQVGPIEHESNGGREDVTRSLNRHYVQASYSDGGIEYAFRAWITSKKRENPDIDQYAGLYELSLDYPGGTRDDVVARDLGWKLRGRNLDRPDRFSWEGDLLFKVHPLWEAIHANQGLFFLVQYVHGFGESLMDYNRRVRRFGVGFELR